VSVKSADARAFRLLCVAMLVTASGSFSGCAHRLTEDDALTVNKGLDYLWDSGNTIGVRPGMKLVIHAIPLRGEGLMDAPPAPTSYEWVVPARDDPLDRKNVLFANFLAISGMPIGPVNLSVETDLAKRAEAIYSESCVGRICTDEAIGPKYVERVLTPLFSTLKVRYFHQWTSTPQLRTNSVAAVQRKACEPSALVLRQAWDANTAATGALLFRYPVVSPVEYEVLGAGDWFLRGHRGALTPNNKSDWYASSGVGHARGFTEILVPVRVGSSPTSMHLPVCFSVADAEERIGHRVLAVRRSEAFMPRDVEGHAWAKVRDGYFTIWLDDRDPIQDITGSPNLKPQLMLGAGDVLVLSSRRTRPSDAPTPTWSH